MANNSPILKEKDKKEKTLKVGQWQKLCDKKMQELGKLLYPTSLLSNEPTQVMHHFIPKSVSARLRYEWDNLIPLTNKQHCRLHQSPDPTIEMEIREIKGDRWYSHLREMKQETIKVNIDYYKRQLEILENKKLRLEL